MDGREIWDAVVIGAGPSGAASGALLAARGWRVLMLERSAWPREKVCGGCLSAQAVALLRQMGFSEALGHTSALREFILHIPTRDLTLPLPGGAAASRTDLDARLVAEFQRRGGEFLAHASATLLPRTDESHRQIAVQMGSSEKIIRARMVLACDGINGTCLRLEPWSGWRIDRRSFFGISATLPVTAISPHTIHMHVAEGGYVGLARYSDDTTHLAAAISPTDCQSLGGPRQLMARILLQCRAPAFSLATLKLRGTPSLTRRRATLGGHRVLALGDACAYAEPFTGEGIAWALQSALQAVGILPEPGESWPENLPARWQKLHGGTIQRAQRRCRIIRLGLRSPMLLRAAAALIAARPRLADPITHSRLGAPA